MTDSEHHSEAGGATPEGWEQRLAQRLAAPSELADVPESAPTPCLNCAAQVRFAYCPKCGQRRGDYRRSIVGFVREFFAETFEVDGRVGRTLRLLLFRPGALTKEYALGRRQRYVSPLRLYLFVSLMLFGAMSVATKLQTIAAPTADPSAQSERPGIQIERTGLEGTWLEDITRARLTRLEAMSPQDAGVELFTAGLEGLPVTMFVLLPIFAALLKLSMLGTGRYYVEHLAFSVHVHTFWFLALLTASVLSQLTEYFSLLLLVIPGYTVFALQHAYDASWGATLVRSIFVWGLYGMVLAAGIGLTFLAGALFG